MMLDAAVRIVGSQLKHPKARDDILWIVEKANHYSERRNDAIHAPCSIAIGTGKFEIVASYFNGHPRAANLKGKDILNEFAWYEALAETLSRFTQQIRGALLFSDTPWPDRPSLPSLGQKNTLPSQPPQPQTI
jgi:hypothetical protein